MRATLCVNGPSVSCCCGCSLSKRWLSTCGGECPRRQAQLAQFQSVTMVLFRNVQGAKSPGKRDRRPCAPGDCDIQNECTNIASISVTKPLCMYDTRQNYSMYKCKRRFKHFKTKIFELMQCQGKPFGVRRMQ